MYTMCINARRNATSARTLLERTSLQGRARLSEIARQHHLDMTHNCEQPSKRGYCRTSACLAL